MVGKVDLAVDIAGRYYVVNAYLHFAEHIHAIEYNARLCATENCRHKASSFAQNLNGRKNPAVMVIFPATRKCQWKHSITRDDALTFSWLGSLV
jgi:hypothetical protein